MQDGTARAAVQARESVDPIVEIPSWRDDACPQVRWELLARLEGAPQDAAGREAVERHLAACAECTQRRDDRDFLRECCRSSPWLEALRLGALTGEAAVPVVRHLLRCDACRDAALPEPAPVPQPEQAALSEAAVAAHQPPAAPHRPPTPRTPWQRRAWVGGGLAALAAAILPATAVLTSAHHAANPPIAAPRTWTRVTVESAPAGHVAQSRLRTPVSSPTTASTPPPGQPTGAPAPVTALVPPQHAAKPAATSSGSSPAAASPTPAPSATPTPIVPPLPVP